MQAEKIVSCEFVGDIESMDLEVDDEDHLFYGDGIATSNSHSVCYAVIGYWTAYAKYHFSIEFFTSWLSESGEKMFPHKEVAELVNDTKKEHIDVLCPDFRVLNTNFITDGQKIRFGLSNTKGVGSSLVAKIQENKTKTEQILNKRLADWNWCDLLFGFLDTINSKAVEAIILAGGFDYLDIPRNTMIYEYDKWGQLTDKEKVWILNKHVQKPFRSLTAALEESAVLKKNGGPAANIKRLEKIINITQSLKKPPHSIEDTPDRIAFEEKKLLGAAISCSILDTCDTARANCSLKEILDGKNEDYMTVAVEVIKLRKHITAKGKKMAFMTVSDGETETDSVVAFTEAYDKFQPLLTENNTIIARLKRSDRGSLLLEAAYQC